MTSKGLGNLQRMEGRIYAKDYIALLHGDLYLSLERLGYTILTKSFFSMIMLLYIKRRLFKNGFWSNHLAL
jgi:hypothetical protein